MNLYIDLDETLIHSTTNSARRRTKVELSDGEKFYVFLRPKAIEMLNNLREIGDVKMFTSATREYARAMNDIFNLNFNQENILAREDCWSEESVGYGKDLFALKMGVDKNSILIDNLPAIEIWPRRKMFFLGILADRYIQIRGYSGGKDPEKFNDEWAEILAAIKNFKKLQNN